MHVSNPVCVLRTSKISFISVVKLEWQKLVSL